MIKNIDSLRKEYLKDSLSEGSVLSHPLKQFDIWLKTALKAEVDEPNAMVLSTSDTGGHVSARVVLLKSVTTEGFTFFTNYNSRKGQQLSENPFASLTFFWYALERQVRVEGEVTRLNRSSSEAYFQSRPLDSRISAIISPQSTVIPDRSFLENSRTEFIAALQGNSPSCPLNWGGYLLKPNMVEFWQGREHRLHDRIRYVIRENDWVIERLAP